MSTQQPKDFIGKTFFALLSLALAYVATVLLVLTRGRPSGDPGWDDVGYLLHAKKLLDSLIARGVGPTFFEFLADQPHSPYMAVVGLLGFILFGIGNVGPYLINSIFVLVLTTRSLLLLPSLTSAQAVFAAAVIIASPFGNFMVGEFRPDVIYALTAAIALMEAYRSSLTQRKPGVREVVMVSLLFFVKPSFFAVSFMVLLLVIVVSVRDFWFTKSWFSSVFIQYGKFMLLISPVLLWTLPSAYDYVLYRLLGREAELWNADTFTQRLEAALETHRQLLVASGWGLPAFAILLLGSLLIIILSRKVSLIDARVVGGLAAFGAIGALASILAGHTNLHFAAIAAWSLILLATFLAGLAANRTVMVSFETGTLGWFRKASESQPNWSKIVLALLAPFVLVFLSPTKFVFVAETTRAPILVNSRIVHNILDACALSHACVHEYTSNKVFPPTYVVTESEVSAANLAWNAAKLGYRVENVLGADYNSSFDSVGTIPADTLFVVAGGSKLESVDMSLPLNQAREQWSAFFLKSPDWSQLHGGHIGEFAVVYQSKGS